MQECFRGALRLASLFLIAIIFNGSGPQARAQSTSVWPDLDQGWSQQQRKGWYTATQGSRLIPWEWLLALEQPDNADPFLEPKHVASFGYLLNANANQVLPVGFAIDIGPDTGLDRTSLRWKAGQGPKEPWVGMTCAACHTAELTFKGQPIRIDGGPAVADFQKFIDALNAALLKTQSDSQKWDRFSTKILATKASNPIAMERLKSAFAKLLDWQTHEAKLNETGLEYGPGRVDMPIRLTQALLA